MEDKLKEARSYFKTRSLQLYFWQKKELTQMGFSMQGIIPGIL